MILIADSGSTKTHWILKNGTSEEEFYGIGLNPQQFSADAISAEIRGMEGLVSVATSVQRIYFFGAGCSSDALKGVVSAGLQQVFSAASIHVDSDMMACALATCGMQPGICCILGTGSNSAYFNGSTLEQAVPSLGYILGDEGSGAYFGKLLLRDFFYKRLPQALHQELEQRGMSKDEMVDRLYRSPGGNRYLASFMPLLESFREEPYVRQLLIQGFWEFLAVHVKPYPQLPDVKVHFVGSVAFHFKNELAEACALEEIEMGKVVKEPLREILRLFGG